MRRHLLISEYLTTPWAMMPERMNAMGAVLARWASGEAASEQVMAGVRADAAARQSRRDNAAAGGGGMIAVLPMYGIVAQRGGNVDDISGPGVMSTQRFTQAFREAMADPAIGGILIDVDSPGGSVYGVAELADEIYQARSKKPSIAIANSLAASAAYWLGSAAGEFLCTPGGEVGSIGVWMAHQDFSKAYADAGIVTTLIAAGKYKTEGNGYSPLDPEAQSFMQQRVNDYYGMFTKGVARYRGTSIDAVRGGMGQGRVLGPQDAKAEGMIDDIATFDEAVKRLGKQIKTGGSPAAATVTNRAAQLRRELEIASA